MDWVFQYKPDEYDLVAATRETLTDWWAMPHHYKEVSEGDRVYLLRSGKDAAITAVAEITRRTYQRETRRGNRAVNLVVQLFVDPALSRREMARDLTLASVRALSMGIQGTNFRLSKQEATALDALISGRTHTAVPGFISQTRQPLRRWQTALHPGLEAIKIYQGQAVAVQVQFYADPGQPAAYCDARSENGEIVLIGRGKAAQGDQQPTHGNAVLLSLIDDARAKPFPIYEKLAKDSYQYLGDFLPVDHSYGELDESTPGYKVYRFRLAPFVPPSTGLVTAEQNLAADFERDLGSNIPPGRKQYVRSIIVRNRAIADKLKCDAGYKCQKCQSSTPWKTELGVPYVEVHHIVELGDDGFDKPQNMIVLCSNCHRFLHFGSERTPEIAALRSQRGL